VCGLRLPQPRRPRLERWIRCILPAAPTDESGTRSHLNFRCYSLGIAAQEPESRAATAPHWYTTNRISTSAWIVAPRQAEHRPVSTSEDRVEAVHASAFDSCADEVVSSLGYTPARLAPVRSGPPSSTRRYMISDEQISTASSVVPPCNPSHTITAPSLLQGVSARRARRRDRLVDPLGIRAYGDGYTNVWMGAW